LVRERGTWKLDRMHPDFLRSRPESSLANPTTDPGTAAYGKRLADSLSDADLATLVYDLMAERNTRATAALAACFRGPND